jgi:hypothetical protein
MGSNPLPWSQRNYGLWIRKSEFRIPKSETNSQIQNSNAPNASGRQTVSKFQVWTLAFEIWCFEFVSDFVLRISDFVNGGSFRDKHARKT